MWFYFFVFIVLLAVGSFVKLKMPIWIGKSGENFIARRLDGLDSLKYKILNDVMLPSHGNTSTTQIDHIVVSNFGIFCIETKSYQGWIFGSADQKYWTQVIYRNKQRFYNPFWQNFAHLKAVELLLGNKLKSPIISFVVFPDADKLKIFGTNNVGYPKEIVEKIKNHATQIYSDIERDEIFDLLSAHNIVDREARREHNREVRIKKSV